MFLINRNKKFFHNLKVVISGAYCAGTFNFGYALKSIFRHPIFTDEHWKGCVFTPLIEPLVVEIYILTFMSVLCSVVIGNITIDYRILRYIYILIVCVIKFNHLRQGEFQTPCYAVFRYCSSGFFVLHFHIQLF